MTKEKDKRLYKRFAKEIHIRYAKVIHRYDFLENLNDRGTSVNISAGGICIKLKESVKVGELLRLSFILPNSFSADDFKKNNINTCNNSAEKTEPIFKIKCFEGLGEVIRISEGGNNINNVCVKFINIAPEISQKLDYHLNQ